MRLTAAGSRPVGSPAGGIDPAEGTDLAEDTDHPAAGSPVEDTGRPAGNHPGGSHLAGASPAAGRNRTGHPSR